MNTKKTVIIGIAGASASGKSLFAHTIVSEICSEKVVVIPEDNYYKDLSHLNMEERAKINFDHPNSLDHILLENHLQLLKNGKSIDSPNYDHSTHSRSKKTIHIANHAIIILEGILLLSEDKIRKNMDIKIFMDSPLDVCFVRRLKRDLKIRGRTIESVIQQYENTVRPMYFQFIEPSKRYADIIVPRGGKNRIAIEMVKTKIRELLEI